MNKRKNRQKKSPSEAKTYRNNLGDNKFKLSGTCESKDSMLSGSDEIGAEQGNLPTAKQPVRKKPVSLIVQDWIRENWVSILVSIIVIPLMLWLINTALQTRENMAVFEYRIDALEKEISEVSDNTPNKEVLELKLDILKKEIEDLNIEDIEGRIFELEKEMKNINKSEEER